MEKKRKGSLTGAKQKTQSSTIPQAQPGTNVPILAFSDNTKGNNTNSTTLNNMQDVYNFRFQGTPTAMIAEANKNSEGLRNANFVYSDGPHNIDGSSLINQGSTPKKKIEKPDKIFDPKPPTNLEAITSSSQKQINSSQPQASQVVTTNQQPVQNVFQFNVRVNNNGFPISQNEVTVNGSQPTQIAVTHQPKTSGSKSAGNKRLSRERRPASSKNNQDKSTGWQAASMASTQGNAYYANSSVNQQRRLVKKRPQSANRKTMMVSQARAQAISSFKSPIQTSSVKKQGLLQNSAASVGGNNFNGPGSHQPQKQRLMQYQIAQANLSGGFAQPSLFSQEPSTHTDQNQYNGQNKAGNQIFMLQPLNATSMNSNANNNDLPVGGHPYNKSLKLSSTSGYNMNMKTFSGSKMHQPSSIFGSPEKPTIAGGRGLKNKIPSMTLQSREDLYEQNMLTKMQINNLRNENRKINTKLVVLENQLVQKDKLFEDMYRAAFQPNRQFNPQSATGFYPPTNAHGGVISGHHGSSISTSKVVGASTNAGPTSMMSNQQHAQAQQLINSYKRTIREQARELDRRDNEIEMIKRSVKMTQINQVLVESETYRQECLRLREQLEHFITEQQKMQKQAAMAVTLDEPVITGDQSPTDTFKRDTHPTLMANTQKETTEPINIENPDDIDSVLTQVVQLNLVQMPRTQAKEVLRQVCQSITKDQEDQASLERNSLKQKLESNEKEKSRQGQELIETRQKLAELSNKMGQASKDEKLRSSKSAASHKKELAELTKKHQVELEKVQKAHSDKESELLKDLENAKKELKTIEKVQEDMAKTNYEEIDSNGEEELVEIERQKVKELEKEMETIILQNRDQVKQLAKTEAHYEKLLTKLKADMHKLQKEGEYKDNALQAEKYDNEKKFKAIEGQLTELSKKYQQAENRAKELEKKIASSNPPVHPNSTGRRSTKKSLVKTGRESNLGESSFERAESEMGNKAALPGQGSSQDRSDLGFTSQDDSEPKPLADSQENSKKKLTKIQVNDKTIFGPEGFPLSPKEITKDSPNVQEGYARLKHACQINFIRHDVLENFLFGSSYAPEKKMSIKDIKLACMNKLSMKETAALDFARFNVEQGSHTITNDDLEDTGDQFVKVDQERRTLGIKIVMFMIGQVREDLIFFNAEKEEKMKLIIGEKIQEPHMKQKLLQAVQQHRQVDKLSFDKFKSIFEYSGYKNETRTLQCCFIYLLKKNKDLYEIDKKDLIKFIHSSAGKAHDFTMTGAKFPIEDDLALSSDSEDEQPKSTYSNWEDAQTMSPSNTSKENQSKLDNVKINVDALNQTGEVEKKQSKAKPAQNAASTNNNGIGDEVSSDDDFGANDSRSEVQSAVAPKDHQLDSRQDESDDDDFCANDSRSESQKQSTKPPVAAFESQENDDDSEFGANDSRSEYSVPHKSQEDDIPDETSPKDNNYLQVKAVMSHNEIEDSLARDIESSQPGNTLVQVGKIAAVSSVPAESRQAEELAPVDTSNLSSHKVSRSQHYVTAPQSVNKESEILHTENPGDYDKDGAVLTQVVVKDDSKKAPTSDSGKSQTSDGNGGKIDKKGRRKPQISIDLKSLSNKPASSQDAQSIGGNVADLNAQPLRQGPALHVENYDDNDVVMDPSKNAFSPPGELHQLKPNAPVPFGINVIAEQHSEYQHSDKGTTMESKNERSVDDIDKKDPLLDDDTVEEIKASAPNTDRDEQKKIFQDCQKAPVKETASILVEDLQTEKSEADFSMPEVDYEELIKTNAGNNQPQKDSILESPNPSILKPGNSAQNLEASPAISLPSAQKLIDDSFGQAHHSKASAEKATNQLRLPPMELLQLKLPDQKPQGINVGQLLTDRSARPGDEQISDFKGIAEQEDKGSESYSDDVGNDDDADEDIINAEEAAHASSGSLPELNAANMVGAVAVSPADFKKAMLASNSSVDGQDPPSAIKQVPKLTTGEDSPPTEIEEDYEF